MAEMFTESASIEEGCIANKRGECMGCKFENRLQALRGLQFDLRSSKVHLESLSNRIKS